MPFELAGLTDVGRKREHNEDALLLAPDLGLVVVADGMGGHEAGEVASNLAVEDLELFFRALAEDPDATWPHRTDPSLDLTGNKLVVAIQRANRTGKTSTSGMASSGNARSTCRIQRSYAIASRKAFMGCLRRSPRATPVPHRS